MMLLKRGCKGKRVTARFAAHLKNYNSGKSLTTLVDAAEDKSLAA
jgi:hypothetical protein